MLFAKRFDNQKTHNHIHYPLAIVAALLIALAVSLSACGLSSATSLVPGSGDTATATTSASWGASAKPCPVVGTSVNLGTPALVLTPKSANQEATAHVGDQIVVELPTTSRWRLAQAQSAQLQPNDPQGALDDSLNACVWSFHAQSAGDATLDFTGSAVCESGQACPEFQLNLSFAIKVE